ncbi:hypothetical protein D7V86_22790 [bacterium D16-51]|nr:hypothetical protein D7V96_22840 [bacterium D16-59]RKI54785.1 hypothetical protein D7V86_22790 [bacterium D16-51]
MKKRILSKYSEKKNERTVQLQMSGRTLETRGIESSDPDEFELGPTNITKSVENSDPDEFFLEPTVVTENVEASDPDEFLVSAIANCYEGDFDSILLI